MKPWGSSWDASSRAPLRVGVASIMALSQALEAYQVSWQARVPARYPVSAALSQWLGAAPGAAWALLAIIVLGLLGVARDRRPILGGLVALGAAAVLSEWQTQIFGSPSRNAFFPGLVVLGWTLGQVWAINLDAAATRAARERLAEAGALGCLAAAYVGSALSKLFASGAAWADGAQVRALMLQQQPIAGWSWLGAYRNALIESPDLAAAASVATLIIEGGAFLLLFGPRVRLTWAALILGLHLNITLLNSMPYVGASLLVALLCIPWRGLAQRGRRADAPGASVPLPVVVLLVCIVVAAWALAPLGWKAAG